jgi:hydrogenase maturation protease
MADNTLGGQSAPHSSILILGVGNILLGDEGVGVRVIEAMQEMDLPDTIELLDGGTASIDILEFLKNRERVIVIDAVQGGGGEPGTLYRFTPADIKVRKPVYTSLHQVGLLESLTTLEYTGESLKDIIIFGVEVEKLGWSLELSPDIKAVIPRIIEKVLEEICEILNPDS